MKRFRVIPVLLLKGVGLYKTVKFKEPKYIGDPINAIRIFNEKEVDELVFLDIEATLAKRTPNYDMLKNIASECFMPLCYGGGVTNLKQIDSVLNTGVEKIAINTSLAENPKMVIEACRIHGSSTILASIDYRKNFWREDRVYTKAGSQAENTKLIEMCKRVEDYGVGEILLNSIDRDGLMSGYDIEMIEKVASALSIPVIACGGAGCLQDFRMAVELGKASAVAAGSFFVFTGKHKAVLITYPTQEDLRKHVYSFE